MKRPARPKRPLGLVLHHGRSDFDGSPYVVIMPLGKSSNKKTGSMLQTYILRTDMHPLDAVMGGGDKAICGNCPLRGLVAQTGKRKKTGNHRACYVNVGQGPRAVWKAYRDGRYVPYDPTEHDQYIRGRKIRFGTYGEPVLIPLSLVQYLADLSSGWTGYTHQWRNLRYADYKRLFVASVHGLTGPGSREHAKHLGWRTFRTTRDGDPADGEILCPPPSKPGSECLARRAISATGPGGARPGCPWSMSTFRSMAERLSWRQASTSRFSTEVTDDDS